MAQNGGKRIGAGRKPGSTNREYVDVRDYYTDQEVKEFFTDLYKRAKTSDKIAVYLAEQMTGKASQAVDVGVTGNISVTFDQSFNAPTSETKSNRKK